MKTKYCLFITFIIFAIFLITPLYAGNICKNAMDLYGDGCEEVCNKGLKNNSKYQYKSHYETNLSQGSFIFPISAQKRCICIYTNPKSEVELGDEYMTCEFAVTVINKPLPVRFEKFSIPNKPVENLVKIATLQPTSFGDQGSGSKIGFASSIIANVYYKGIHYFSSYYALILLTILFAGTLFLFGFSNFFTILKSPQQIWSLLTGTDFKSKSAQVILAIVFFGLPVNIEMVYDTNSPELKSQASKLIYSKNIIEHCHEKLGKLAEAEKIHNECLKKYDDNYTSSNTGSGIFVYTEDDETKDQPPSNNCENEERNYKLAYDEFEKCRQQYQPTDQELNVFDDNNNNNITQKRHIKEGLQVPFASVIVAGFVNFGMKTAEKVSQWSSEAVQSYLFYKLVNNNEMNMSSLKRLDNKIKNSPDTLFQYTITLPPACVGNEDKDVKTCDDINQIIINSDTKFQYPFCISALEDAKRRCEANTSIVNTIKDTLPKIQQQQITELKSRFEQSTTTIQDNFSFMSPALMPMVMVTYPFSQLVNKKDPPVMVEKVSESEKSNIVDKIETAYNFVSKGFAKAKYMSKTAYNFFAGNNNEAVEQTEMIDAANKTISTTISRDKEIAYFMGYSTVIANVPPGSIIKKHLIDFFSKLLKAGGAALKVALPVLVGIASVVMTFASGLGAGAVVFIGILAGMIGGLLSIIGITIEKLMPLIEVALELVINYIAVNITIMILIMLPFFAIVIAGTIRFIHYIYEIIKTMITLPFYALPVATRRTEGVFMFFGDLVKLSVIPVLIAASISFAIFFALVFEFFMFDLPFHLILSQVMPNNYASLFLFGLMTASLQLVSCLVSTYYLFKITMNFPEYIISAVGRIIGMATPGQSYQEFAKEAFDKAKTAMLARV